MPVWVRVCATGTARDRCRPYGFKTVFENARTIGIYSDELSVCRRIIVKRAECIQEYLYSPFIKGTHTNVSFRFIVEIGFSVFFFSPLSISIRFSYIILNAIGFVRGAYRNTNVFLKTPSEGWNVLVFVLWRASDFFFFFNSPHALNI